MSVEEDGILENLPRSRPGRRSARRETPGTAAGPPPRSPRSPDPEPPTGDALGGALRAAGQLTEAGLKAASKLAGGALGRLPRR